jgi:hypothetical protein
LLTLTKTSRILLACLLASSLFAAGCKEAVKTIGELQVLQAALTKQFGDQVSVNVNHTDKNVILTVSFINSALNEKTALDRYRRAEETAKAVNAHYARIKEVGVIWIGFVRYRTRMLVFHYTQTLDFFPFDRNGQPLQPREEPSTSEVRLEVSANYLPNSNESNVFAYGIQLEGQPGQDGVTVLPHFTITGDANAAAGKPPKTVQFDFSSYSSTPRFPETVPITFMADGQQLAQTKATFNGHDAQFCKVAVPYAAFRKMIGARSLTIKVGAREYPLTPFQFAALQKMGEYVTE